MIRNLIIICLACASMSFAKGTWEEQQAYAEEKTVEHLEACPQVRSDRFVVKTVELPDGQELLLDLRIERPREGGPFPVVFYVHGGGWITGSKSHFAHQSFELAKHGIAGVRLEYRWRSQGAKYPEAISDVMDAIDFIRQRADELNLDFTRVGLAGGSAGGHLSSIAAQLTPECICYDGYNGLFDALERARSHFGGGDYTGTTEEEKKAASAIYNIKHPPPDTLLYHGTEDTTIDIDVARRFAEAVRKRGGNAALLVYEGVGHSFFGKEPYLTATTRALLAHTSFVFGLTDLKPEISDYVPPPKIAQLPSGFSLVDSWKDDAGKRVEFFVNGAVDYASGQRLQWLESYGNYYVVWQSGHYGNIEVLDRGTIRIGKVVYRKDSLNPAVLPVPRETGGKAWLVKRLAEVAKELDTRDLSKVKVVFVGDSITQGWLEKGAAFWQEAYANALNLGVSGDRTEHVLYRLKTKRDGGMGNFDDPKLQPKTIVLMIGTNNLFKQQPDQIIEGIVAVRDRLLELEPQAEIVLCSVLPTSDATRNRDIVVPINLAIQSLENVHWLDLYSLFVDTDGLQRLSFFKDGVHLNEAGYQLWYDSLVLVIEEGDGL
ncbi:GDSL-type esterase/lipase family protein [Pontiella sulfatireligans]|uniref:Carboxylesterase NlhH n=1 Tax=Pontiella sulfatireligans TaxID=2750658 RepID=A0A6C2UNP7_9BACT|nr:GDSL-type esterase/lipase family protein [Pontiella sulfatireligans]VGO21885.1 Carboxylesterase NlhH [Pontiella sulfatireligans]